MKEKQDQTPDTRTPAQIERDDVRADVELYRRERAEDRRARRTDAQEQRDYERGMSRR